MGYDQDGTVGVLPHALKHLNQVLEAPQINACLRLVKHGKLGSPGNNSGNLDSLELTAGQAGVDLTVDVVLGAKPHLCQVLTGF